MTRESMRLNLLLVSLGLLLGGAVMGTAARWQAPVVAALAEQEQARAETLRAEAARAWAETRATLAAAPGVIAGKEILAVGLNLAFVILAVGTAVAFVIWATVHAGVVYPNAQGQYPIVMERRANGEVWVHDTARALQASTYLMPGGVYAPAVGSEEAALQLATQAQASSVMIGIAGKAQAEQVVERVNRAGASLPAPSFGQNGGGPRFVYVKDRAAQQQTAQIFMADLRELIEQGWGARSLHRAMWIGYRFHSGNKCSRPYYDRLMEKLSKAACARAEGEGWTPAVPLADALQAFGLETD